MTPDNETIKGTDYSWDYLLTNIEEGVTIPVIGPEVLTTPDGRTLNEHLAVKLAEKLNVSSRVSDPKSLNMTIVESDDFPNKRQRIYPRLKEVLDQLINEGAFPMPEALLKLAEIKPFQLFLSTTFDQLLRRALDRVRFDIEDGKTALLGPATSTLTYTPTRFDDLPADWSERPRPTVFHLFGRAGVMPTDYAATDGDLLEWLHAMQSGEGRPQRLFEKLRHSNLLLLGVGFPDWLARFFLRVAKDSRLLENRERFEILADNRLNSSDSLVYFCHRFSWETSIYEGGAVEFINELHERWQKRETKRDPRPSRQEPSEDEMKPKDIFISYASEDREKAERVKTKLETKGLEVWYDRDRLKPAHFFENRIRDHIQRCDLFVPIISKTACAYDGYYRQEWFWAGERVRQFYGTERPFILPVNIDQTPANSPNLPETFRSVQWMDAPDGKLKEESIEQVCEALREVRKRGRRNA
ncbi:MAG TPA: toll/interleukin-1 receptor domain-containing protein [Candidatus Baltobacteraceae bacterium]|nr:toll/interleukin-1 receptor domain-containing protein [Candidatus Baltobacteraceae bacterium]